MSLRCFWRRNLWNAPVFDLAAHLDRMGASAEVWVAGLCLLGFGIYRPSLIAPGAVQMIVLGLHVEMGRGEA